LAEGTGGSHPIFYLGLRRIGIVPPRRDDPPILIRVIRVIRGCNPRSPKFVSIRVHSWLPSLRDCLERRKRFVDLHPRQFVFEEDRFLRRKRCRIVERRNREIDRVRIFAVFKKQMSAATRRKRTNPIRVWNLAGFPFCHQDILARHRSPSHMRRTGASPAIDAMTIDQRNWPTLQHISCPAANASTSELSGHAWCQCRLWSV
jgi:hypothetical protein